jgi:hypothetical protein
MKNIGLANEVLKLKRGIFRYITDEITLADGALAMDY